MVMGARPSGYGGQAFARWMKWYEDNRDQLRWDEKGKRYMRLAK